jgi:hypothetical protein
VKSAGLPALLDNQHLQVYATLVRRSVRQAAHGRKKPALQRVFLSFAALLAD